jgi:hypothetical protein
MDPRIHDLHIKAGTLAGLERTCGVKQRYPTEEHAQRASDAMNKKPTTRKELEPYPCAFCHQWHVGRKMSLEELETASNVSQA